MKNPCVLENLSKISIHVDWIENCKLHKLRRQPIRKTKTATQEYFILKMKKCVFFIKSLTNYPNVSSTQPQKYIMPTCLLQVWCNIWFLLNLSHACFIHCSSILLKMLPFSKGNSEPIYQVVLELQVVMIRDQNLSYLSIHVCKLLNSYLNWVHFI